MKYLLVFLLPLLLISCNSFDKELWKFDYKKPVSVMNYKTKPKLNGFYRLDTNILSQKDKSRARFFIDEGLFFFEEGYFSVDKKYSSLFFNAGRFSIEKDSIFIQYFKNTNLGATITLAPYTVHELHGILENDSVITIHRIKFKTVYDWNGLGPGIYAIEFEPKLVFNFVELNPIPNLDNRIKDKLK